MPGYTLHFCDALVTNFHQPKSTLLVLIAALIGDDWKNVYKAALENEYRFLSYGDSSILYKKQDI
jgi:S-adenosylmethionine:tRNA ribosyltransferase-isomerase